MTPETWRRIDELFHAAIEKPAAERDSFLAELASAESDIHHEVASLVAAHEEATGFLSMPPVFAPEASQDRLTASMVGPYRIEREIGAGGMGTVYAASRADQQFERRVALKVVRAGIQNESILARFLTERQILATLEHPNIARLLDGGVTPDGRPYLVTELVDGAPLNEYCASKNLPMDARLDLFAKICSAVQYAHQRLVIHRDLKPGNILVSQSGEPKLLDFGIAKVLDPKPSKQPPRTVGLFTPRYASPEQLSGAVITTASDIYALGVILYELVTGRHPFASRLGSRSQLHKAMLECEPEPPSSVDKQLRGDLETIVLMALRKEPERRYRSAAQFADDVGRYRQNLPVAARKDTILYVASKFVARHKLPACATAAVVAVLAGGLALTAYQARVAKQERTEAEFVENFVKTTLAGADPTYNSPFADKGRALRISDVLDLAVERVRAELRDQPLLAAQLLRAFSADYLRLGLKNKAAGLAREAQMEERKAGP
ncbi:MAG TPA: serine/threonine-protein kinase [Bryobacteraceae bacterium]|nr:serine/threonine-protein kinase [Bryobacteraceae bacterium]